MLWRSRSRLKIDRGFPYLEFVLEFILELSDLDRARVARDREG